MGTLNLQYTNTAKPSPPPISMHTSSNSSWTVFPEVLARLCTQCDGTPACSSKPRARKAASDTGLSGPNSFKKRQVDAGRAIRGGAESPAIALEPPTSDLEKAEWFQARRLKDVLSLAPVLPSCFHPWEWDSVPVTISLNEAIVTVRFADEILASKDDIPCDHSWAQLPGRGGLENATIFGVLASGKKSNVVFVLATVVRDAITQGIHLQSDIYLHQSLFSDSLVIPRAISTFKQDLINFVFPPALKLPKPSESAVNDLYSHLTPPKTSDPPASIQPEQLLPQLLPFQQRSVSWLLSRESASILETGMVGYKPSSGCERLPFSWEQVQTTCKQNLFVNRLSGSICKASEDLLVLESEPRGGILADEMGLGKTVEMLALILLNRRQCHQKAPVADATKAGGAYDLVERLSDTRLNATEVSGKDIRLTMDDPSHTEDVMAVDSQNKTMLIATSATLVVTPPSILHQWASEIENHAPTLRVYVYLEEQHKSITATDLAKYDVVLTTYPVLSKEINYTHEYERPRRHERHYVPRMSPFVKIHWWRVCLDEAQMIEGTTVSQAAAMTLMIPRVMSWAISGTPIRRHIEDLHSLLQFLNQDPVASDRRLWRLLTTVSFRSTFISSFQRIMHCYAKTDVARELAIPQQRRLVYGIDFSDIERTHFIDIWNECAAECDLDGLDKNTHLNLENLQVWLTRLRQTCCHPQISTWSKENLGYKNVRTVDKVLEIMLQKNLALLSSKEKALVSTKIKRAVLGLQLHKGPEELALFEQIEEQVHKHVLFWKVQMEGSRSFERGGGVHESPGEGHQFPATLHAPLTEPSRGTFKKHDAMIQSANRYRDWQEQHHRLLFCMGGVSCELGLMDKSCKLYGLATKIREDMLAAPERKFNKVLDQIMTSACSVSLDATFAIPTPTLRGGVALSKQLRQLEGLVETLNQQLHILHDWRSHLLDALTQPLSESADMDFEGSRSSPSSLQSCLHHYGRMLFFRKDLLVGTSAIVGRYVLNAKEQKDHARMTADREKRARRLGDASTLDTEVGIDQMLEQKINDLITPELVFSLKVIKSTFESFAKTDKQSEGDKAQAEAEAGRLRDIQEQHLAQVERLEIELGRLRTLASARELYQRHLKGISDTVIEVDSRNPRLDIARCTEEELVLSAEVARLTSKQRYLEHVAQAMEETTDDIKENAPCLICSDHYDYGLVTECGHVFCRSCLTQWIKLHSKCPSCKSHISRSRLTLASMVCSTSHETDRGFDALAHNAQKPTLTEFHASLLSDRVQPVPDAIQLVKIRTGYGSKIDSIVRHVKFLIQEDPAVKCLIFSQWSALLHLLTESLTLNHVGHVRLDSASNKTAVHEFKTSKDEHVFMLHAKSQSAGLTLLQATHIFICEPLVNPALQAQAVSRIHRIGQTKETFVHYYLLRDTVEVACAEVSGLKVIEHPDKAMGKLVDGGQASENQGTLQQLGAIAVFSQPAGSRLPSGEHVKKNDLRYCLSSQRKMVRSLESVSTLRARTADMAGAKSKAFLGEDQDQEYSPFRGEDALSVDDNERQVFVDEDGTMRIL